MKIERVVMPYTGSELGGSHISSFTLGQALQRDHGIEAVVYANAGTLIAEEATRRGLTVRTLNETLTARHNPLYDVMRMPARIAMLRREGPNILVHSNGMGSLQSWGPAAKLLGRPLIYHNRAFNRAILYNRLLWQMPDMVLCVSQSIKGVMSFLPQDRVRVIDNPFELTATPDRMEERARLARELDLPEDALLIGYAANFWKRKRPIFFLDVCKRIGEVHPNARFVVFGRKGDQSEDMLRAHAAAIGIADRTRFAGFRLPGEANIIAMDVHLIPALEEPFGRTPIESLLLGTPYVAINDAGNEEIGRRFGGGRMLAPDASVEQFAAASLEVIADPVGTRLSTERRRIVTGQLSAHNHVTNILEVYNELAAARP
ncbi:glycosyltransferase family 4 protein [Sphingomonas montana]|uniref:glycosyltransferase family 4 protein n=1 Tax=Sphingomonas montana TaxID=1843236 RepID=UPI00096FA8A9|nr:glycosyltransferase family 4 protein [Sphingomonas montana]